ncbi:hypothetical protein K08M3_51300 [Vibrio alginolyticus]|uniref:DUF5983 domain-containing protein n=1 Tax=Vibrio alginolyticus TaxID=663 RepID=A0A1W6TLW8_VIBAL|nr:hypothetical protein [Vibrio alginolyticus]EHU6485572.1 hypothetical protein [Vibrio parahaemolyticus]ARP06640.1 hypothetical protein K04M1_51170 [Vibrio alginolyticus]ARP11773.1 hypothetical protein K04M3_52040 [Vibrio alginolyticus]ARP16826.1 hypothetical protein K04M5_51740 [Vibrio alginolyticus]ARP21863.1 hypothetical protein K05K4_51610 [Vibrio alginolyticus]
MEKYIAIGFNITHLTPSDKQVLQTLADDPSVNRVMDRDSGFILKLCGEQPSFADGMSDSFQTLISIARMHFANQVEFDVDIKQTDGLDTFE